VFGTVVGELWRNIKTELPLFTEPHRRGERAERHMHVRSLHSLLFYNMSAIYGYSIHNLWCCQSMLWICKKCSCGVCERYLTASAAPVVAPLLTFYVLYLLCLILFKLNCEVRVQCLTTQSTTLYGAARRGACPDILDFGHALNRKTLEIKSLRTRSNEKCYV